MWKLPTDWGTAVMQEIGGVRDMAVEEAEQWEGNALIVWFPQKILRP